MELVAPVQWPLHKNRYQKCGKSSWLVWYCLHHPLCTIWSKHEPHTTDPDWRAAGVYSCYVSISVCVSGGCHCKFRLLHSQLTTVEWDVNFFQPFIYSWLWLMSCGYLKLNLQLGLPETEFTVGFAWNWILKWTCTDLRFHFLFVCRVHPRRNCHHQPRKRRRRRSFASHPSPRRRARKAKRALSRWKRVADTTSRFTSVFSYIWLSLAHCSPFFNLAGLFVLPAQSNIFFFMEPFLKSL